MSVLDFSNCMYDLSKVGKNERITEVFPELQNYDEIIKASDSEIRIAFALADFNSPVVRIKDITQRFKILFEYLDIDLKIVANKALFESLSEWTNVNIANVASAYLFMQNNHDFTHWWNLNQLFYSLMQEMGKPRQKIDGELEDINKYVKRQLDIQKQSNPIKSELQGIEANLFSDAKMRMAVAKSKLTKIRTYSEMHAVENSVI